MKRITNMLLALIMLSSCSVKEVRTDCPCWLMLFVEDNVKLCDEMIFTAWTTEKEKEEAIDLKRYPDTYETTVPRRYITTCLYAGIRRGDIKGDEYHIQFGQDADSLYSYSNVVDCIQETAQDTVVLKKNFARVYLKMTTAEGERYPYTLIVRSDIAGTNLITDEPIYGRFEKKLELDSQNQTVFTLPRQAVDRYTLTIDIYNGDKLIYAVPLGKQVAEMGYDWEEDNLKDIGLGVDYAEATVEISIKGWKTDKFVITI